MTTYVYINTIVGLDLKDVPGVVIKDPLRQLLDAQRRHGSPQLGHGTAKARVRPLDVRGFGVLCHEVLSGVQELWRGVLHGDHLRARPLKGPPFKFR